MTLYKNYPNIKIFDIRHTVEEIIRIENVILFLNIWIWTIIIVTFIINVASLDSTTYYGIASLIMLLLIIYIRNVKYKYLHDYAIKHAKRLSIMDKHLEGMLSTDKDSIGKLYVNIIKKQYEYLGGTYDY